MLSPNSISFTECPPCAASLKRRVRGICHRLLTRTTDDKVTFAQKPACDVVYFFCVCGFMIARLRPICERHREAEREERLNVSLEDKSFRLRAQFLCAFSLQNACARPFAFGRFFGTFGHNYTTHMLFDHVLTYTVLIPIITTFYILYASRGVEMKNKKTTTRTEQASICGANSCRPCPIATQCRVRFFVRAGVFVRPSSHAQSFTAHAQPLQNEPDGQHALALVSSLFSLG